MISNYVEHSVKVLIWLGCTVYDIPLYTNYESFILRKIFENGNDQRFQHLIKDIDQNFASLVKMEIIASVINFNNFIRCYSVTLIPTLLIALFEIVTLTTLS